MADNATIPPPGQYILVAGAVLGIMLGCALIFISPIQGMIPGAFFGVGGAAVGTLIARPIALAVNKRQKK
jgi:hypothetical protein